MNKQSNPNPQGKGLVPVLDCLTGSRAMVSVHPKHIEQISRELFTSLFVLHSKFQFKPVVGKSYWLYRRSNSFQLSMISPTEWGENNFGQIIGECILQKDITWTLTLDENTARNEELMTLIENRQREFEQALSTVDSIDKVLPFYLESLPFYQRVFASALASSLRDSMFKSGIQGLSYNQARQLLSEQ
ncbi:MAG: DUF2452 domain-containing protein [Gammaproteobacteria bacterium]|nr:DUF2452 domain-containing protein [Gammaproteobacteria bacterium]